MGSPISWSDFLREQCGNSLLIFVHGMRLPVATGVACDVHSHRSIEVVYHPTGSGVTRLAGEKQIEFNRGDAVIYPPGLCHDQVNSVKGEDLCIHLAVPKRHSRIPSDCLRINSVEDSSIIEDMRLLSADHVSRSKIEQNLLNLRGSATLFALLNLSTKVSGQRQEIGARRHAGAAVRYILENYGRIRSVKEISDHVGISSDRLRHVFRIQNGKGMTQYLSEIRVERAKTLLIHSAVPIKQIATMCGFRDEYYFSTVFQKIAFCPPGRYRAGRDRLAV